VNPERVPCSGFIFIAKRQAWIEPKDKNHGLVAATFHDQLSAGTELAIFQEPWDPEEAAPKQLPASVDLGIDFPNGAAVVWVRDVIGSEAVIQTSDLTKWRMVVIDLKELKYPPPSTEDAACTYWIVTDRIV